MFAFESREVVRVKVKKCDGFMQPEVKKFCLDPQITSFEMLQHLLTKAFEIKGDFTISYVANDNSGEEVYLSLLSDWDLDAAFLGSSEPYLRLKVDLKPFEPGLIDWDIVTPADITQPRVTQALDKSANIFNTITGTITQQVGRTVSQVQVALGIKEDEVIDYMPTKSPLSDEDYRSFLDVDGRLNKPAELRLAVYERGIEASLRRVVWRHLLNVYPVGLTGKERMDYMKRKSAEYMGLREEWKSMMQNGTPSEDLNVIINMVKKDVLRTDRTHEFYAGSDENQNVLSLFNVLVTYAATHPQVSYCQGMSDIASPLLVIQRDEATAYICFCALMTRLQFNFMYDGVVMTTKFQHLSELLQHHDPEFFAYLEMHDAADLFFCYRWLLLEAKREFPFEDALYMLEIMWSSIPLQPPQGELALCDPQYSVRHLSNTPASPVTKENVYTHLRTLRRRASYSSGLNSQASSLKCSCSPVKTVVMEKASPIGTPVDEQNGTEFPSEIPEAAEAMTASLTEKMCAINKSLEPGDNKTVGFVPCDNCIEQVSDSDEKAKNPLATLNRYDSLHEALQFKSVFYVPLSSVGGSTEPRSDQCLNNTSSLCNIGNRKLSPSHLPSLVLDGKARTFSDSGFNDQAGDGTQNKTIAKSTSSDYIKIEGVPLFLPPPDEFGHSNPFLMFICFTLLFSQRDVIMKSRMDYNDLAMLFDKLVRKHNVYKVLHKAKVLYQDYLKDFQRSSSKENSSDFDII